MEEPNLSSGYGSDSNTSESDYENSCTKEWGNDLLLVEVKHLNRDISKKLTNPWPSIKNDCLHGISLLLQRNPSLPIDIDRFTVYLLDVDILLQMWCSYDQDPKAPFEEGDIRQWRLLVEGYGRVEQYVRERYGSVLIQFLLFYA
jgi:hypothetical protein